MESLQLAGNLLAVSEGGTCKNTGTELSEQCRRKTDPMDVSAWIRARVSTDVSGRKQIFLFLFTATALLCGALLEKTNKFLGLKNLDSCSF